MTFLYTIMFANREYFQKSTYGGYYEPLGYMNPSNYRYKRSTYYNNIEKGEYSSEISYN